MSLEGSAVVEEGAYAPIGLQTTLRQMAGNDKGPVIDTNPVFDSAFVLNTPRDFVITATQALEDFGKDKPGDIFSVEWELTMPSWTSSDSIEAPYNIIISLGSSPTTPINYDNWHW